MLALNIWASGLAKEISRQGLLMLEKYPVDCMQHTTMLVSQWAILQTMGSRQTLNPKPGKQETSETLKNLSPKPHELQSEF